MSAEEDSIAPPGDAELARQLIEAVQDGLAVMSLSGEQLDVNSALCEMTGFSREELVGCTAPYPYWPEEELHKSAAVFEAMARGEFYEFEYTCKRKDGTRFATVINPAVVRGADGSVRCFVATVKDVSARRELEAELRRRQKLDAVGELAAGIAHQFNNLLTTILGNASLLEGDVTESSEGRGSVREIQDAAERAAGLTRQLLTLSRHRIVQTARVDMSAAVLEMRSALEVLAGPHELVIDAPQSAVRVRLGRSDLEQIVRGLVLNAVEATPGGGRVTVDVSTHDGHARLRVRDEGQGIEPSALDRIFDPFFSTKGRASGTGLGLSIVHGLAIQAGGRVEVTSQPGCGATFEVWLPIVAPPPAVSDDDARGDAQVTGATILVVDDDASIRSMLTEVLVAAGFPVLEAADGREALELAQRSPVDLVLTDVVMPIVNGVELAVRLRAVRPELPVIFMSGYTGDTVGLGEVTAKDPLALLDKPFTATALLERVRRVLARRRD